MSYDNIFNKVYQTPWLITQEGLDTILAILDRKQNGEELSFEQLSQLREQNEERNKLHVPDSPGIAVLPIQGSIFPKANLLTEFSGGTSIEKLQADFLTLMEEDNVKGILLDIDSPGGSADMIQEMADVIWSARQLGTKPIWASANGMAASAAYYLASQADKLFMTPSGTVGSIGVISIHTDASKADEMEGIKRTILRIGENKALGNPIEPLDDKAKQIKLEEMSEIYDEFVSSVARGRGVSADEVLENYGKGRVYKSRSALEKGMVDGVKTINAVSNAFLDQVFKNKPVPQVKPVPQAQGATMPEITRETLEVLGLNEDATSEDVFNAVTDLHEAGLEAPAGPVLDIPADFAKQFPEQARLMMELQMKSRQDDARMFAQDYERFSTEEGATGFGFSGLALTQVQELHLKITDGVVTHEDLKALLDNVASGNAVVQYGEIGTTHGKENEVPENAVVAATELRDLAYRLGAEEGLSYGDALAKVMNDPENKSLVDAYNSNNAKPVQNSGGES